MTSQGHSNYCGFPNHRIIYFLVLFHGNFIQKDFKLETSDLKFVNLLYNWDEIYPNEPSDNLDKIFKIIPWR